MTLLYRTKDKRSAKKDIICDGAREQHYHSIINSKKTQQPNLNKRETLSSSPYTLTTNHHHYNQIFTKMNSTLLIVFICLQLALVYFSQVNSIKCYNCSSAYDSNCAESFDKTNRTTIDCEERDTLCRKLIQHVEKRVIVTRMCGWIDPDKNNQSVCFKRSGVFAVMSEQCACYVDGCNHSANLVPNETLIVIIITISTIFAAPSWFFK